jgi:hypothetical protein
MSAFVPVFTVWHNEPTALAWKSDTTLLNTRKGYDNLERIAFKRKGKHGQRVEKETPIDYDALNRAIKAENNNATKPHSAEETV